MKKMLVGFMVYTLVEVEDEKDALSLALENVVGAKENDLHSITRVNEEKGRETVALSIVPEDLEDPSLEPLEEAISEYISDSTGFCHTGFSYKIVVEATLDTSE